MADMTLPISLSPSLSTIPDATKRGTTTERMKATAKEFEGVFISTMLNQMFKGIPTKGPFHGGQAEESWRGMLVDEYGKSMAKAGGIGLADDIYRQMLRTQEGLM